ncbi:phosphoenolpyruvate carboxykinase (ATP) [Bacteriovorax sp. PP10]|uniref:Phosphoenolpyruvate carboxykinase (ATP) n=1 Tax=Bacteriovorax antarcticus TaxID=3088717 RepID=A0ABU5VZ22_9BACT|nr:phosphoenolpyruvate carboxykinase (ATP) [Bacteriovorax sp. PP10]MEA9357842.1 phosphoenolpyruvate carboxykinase (ATP) [Bacteriovorax sp. PP10]
MLDSLNFGLSESAKIKLNLPEAMLVEYSLQQDSENKLSKDGALVIKTGNFTGRAANDKYVVLEPYSEKVIDWKNNIRKMTNEDFNSIKLEMLEKFNQGIRLTFVTTKSASADPAYALEVILITPSAAHALFCTNIFRNEQFDYPLGSFTIYHDPDFLVDNTKYPVRSTTVIAINFSTKEIIIAGTGYAGEIKKSIFSVLNTLLPELNVLPMHTGANQTYDGETSLFFGLSGTGKTTLSTDIGLNIIGDDEHGLSESGIFNFEGGCYAKTYGLNLENEPEIFKASNRFKTLLENVVLDELTRKPLFKDKSITENGRSTYSLKALENCSIDSRGPLPSNIFFLSADALGVLPAISLLTSEQAIFYFLTGYTAKLAGTEIGLKEIEVAFSHCFGAPFMMRRAQEYADLLKIFLEKNPIKVWLVNTGWYGGPYGKGTRYPLELTRNCIRSIQKGVKDNNFQLNEIFNLQTPIELDNVDPVYLSAEQLWSDKFEYNKAALSLKHKFEENYKKFSI